MEAQIISLNDYKLLRSEKYNYNFHYPTGTFARWGKTEEDDPEFSPFGMEILDCEISTICSRKCQWCYKSNTEIGTYMSFETFKLVFDKLPKTLTQVAFGIGDIDGNPDMWKIFSYCRENKIVPNVTINGERMKDKYYDNLVKYCGAVAVSHYSDDICFNAVEQLTKRGLKQVNIHKLLCEQTYNDCLKLVDSAKNDEKLEKLKAIVFLWLKPKGNRNTFSQLSGYEQYKALVDYALRNEVGIGFDSCSAPFFYQVIKDDVSLKKEEKYIEPCESTLFSYYINVDGIGYPCSFVEGEKGYNGIDLKKINTFFKDVWIHPETKKFRSLLLLRKDCNGCRKCQVFPLKLEKRLVTL